MKCRRLILILVFTSALSAGTSPLHYIRNVESAWADIDSAEFTLDIRTRIPGLTMPDRHGRVFWISPDSLRLESDGFMIMPPQATPFRLVSSMLDSGFTLTASVPDTLPPHHIRITSTRILENRVFTMSADIDTLRQIITSAQADQGHDFRGTVHFRYLEINGRYFPETVRIDLRSDRFRRQNSPDRRRRLRPADEDTGYFEIRFSEYILHPAP